MITARKERVNVNTGVVYLSADVLSKGGKEERGRKEYEGIVTNLMQFLLELAVLHFKCA